jgi:hypothetical protein
MEIFLTVAVAVLSLVLGVMIIAYYRLRVRAGAKGNDAKRLGVSSPMTEYDEDMDIPAALVGAECKRIIEHFAPALGLKPVKLLRSALIDGLTGGRPVTTDVLDLLDEMVKAGDAPAPSRPPTEPN